MKLDHNLVAIIFALSEGLSQRRKYSLISRDAHKACFSYIYIATLGAGDIAYLLLDGCFRNDVVLVEKCLLNNNIDPDLDTIDKAIMFVCKYSRISILKKFISDKWQRFDFNIKFTKPLHNAVKNNCVEVVRILLANCRFQHNNINAVFSRAAKMGSIEIIHLLLAYDKATIDVETLSVSFLMTCKFGYMDIMELLWLNPKIDPSTNDNYASTRALAMCHFDIVEKLITDPRVLAVEYRNNYILQTACNCGFIEVVKMMLALPHPDPAGQKHYAMISASREGKINVVKMLLPITDPSLSDNEAIKRAYASRHFEIVKLLLDDPRVDNILRPELKSIYRRDCKI